jgi:predicted transcriptional regulator
MTEEISGQIAIGDDVLYQVLDDELVLLNIANSQYYGLDNVGADMWNLLLEHREADIVVNRLREKYEVDETTVRCDLQTLIQSLRELGLLKAGARNAAQ